MSGVGDLLEGRYGIVSLEGCILIFTTTNKLIVNSHDKHWLVLPLPLGSHHIFCIIYLVNFMQILRMQIGGRNIMVVCDCPGLVNQLLDIS